MSTVETWLNALEGRYRANLTSPEFLKAVRALSASYVERRARLHDTRPIESAGKRAAFASHYAPIHFFTAREIARALALAGSPVETIVDFGCGTGVVSAALALERAAPPNLRGIDTSGWTLNEAAWTWRTLGLHGRTRRGDLVAEAALAARHRPPRPTMFVFGWSVNELAAPARDQLLDVLRSDAALGSSLLVIEPLARGVAPWWDAWVRALEPGGARQNAWHFDTALPPEMARVDEAAGFRRDELGARTLWRPAITPR